MNSIEGEKSRLYSSVTLLERLFARATKQIACAFVHSTELLLCYQGGPLLLE